MLLVGAHDIQSGMTLLNTLRSLTEGKTAVTPDIAAAAKATGATTEALAAFLEGDITGILPKGATIFNNRPACALALRTLAWSLGDWDPVIQVTVMTKLFMGDSPVRDTDLIAAGKAGLAVGNDKVRAAWISAAKEHLWPALVPKADLEARIAALMDLRSL